MRIFKPLVLAALPLVTSSALAHEARFRDLTVEQASVAHALMPRNSGYEGFKKGPRVSLLLDRPDASYAVGEAVKFLLTLDEDAYVTVLDVGPTGRVTQLFPNEYQTDCHLFANQPVEIGGNAGAKIVVSGPIGVELIKVLVSRSPNPLVPQAQLRNGGPFHSLDGGARMLVRDLQVLANQAAQRDTEVYVWNVLLRTY
jgi:hypothetical protein